jgi:hypothetical protein
MIPVRKDFATSSASLRYFGSMRVHTPATCCPHRESTVKYRPMKVFHMRQRAALRRQTSHHNAGSLINTLSGSTVRHLADMNCSTLRQPRCLCWPAQPRSKKTGRIFRPLDEFTTCQIFRLPSMTAFTFVGGVTSFQIAAATPTKGIPPW